MSRSVTMAAVATVLSAGAVLADWTITWPLPGGTFGKPLPVAALDGQGFGPEDVWFTWRVRAVGSSTIIRENSPVYTDEEDGEWASALTYPGGGNWPANFYVLESYYDGAVVDDDYIQVVSSN